MTIYSSLTTSAPSQSLTFSSPISADTLSFTLSEMLYLTFIKDLLDGALARKNKGYTIISSADITQILFSKFLKSIRTIISPEQTKITEITKSIWEKTQNLKCSPEAEKFNQMPELKGQNIGYFFSEGQLKLIIKNYELSKPALVAAVLTPRENSKMSI